MTMTNYSYEKDGIDSTLPIEVPIIQALLFAGLLCSSDVVAAVSIVDYEK
jgi:hypothetical protein